MRIPVPGGIHGDRLATGEFAVLIAGQKMLTHLGDLQLPPGPDWPLYHRITAVKGFQIIGQSHHTPTPRNPQMSGTWHFHTGRWHFDERICHGESAAIFDLQGNAHIIEPAPHRTSQGYRYVASDGRLVFGDETKGRNGLNEWTDIGDGMRIGQGWTEGGGPPGGIVFHDGLHFRVIETGHCTFIRVHRHGDRVAITAVKPGEVVMFDITIAALAALPVWRASVTLPPPDKEPLPVATPDLGPFLQYADRRWKELGAAERVSEQPELFQNIVSQYHFTADPNVGLLVQAPGRSAHEDFSEDFICIKDENGVVFSGDAVGSINTSRAFINTHLVPTREARQGAFGIPPPIVINGPIIPKPIPTLPATSVVVDLGAVLAPLKAEIAALKVRLNVVENKVPASAPVAKFPKAVTLRSRRTGKLLSNDANKPEGNPEGLVYANRDSGGSWETFDIEGVE